ncbi:MAG: hypothetical protein AAFV45_06825 [Pseudomonadota bacterium]
MTPEDFATLYQADAWHWYVEDTGQYWSSADRAYSRLVPPHFTHAPNEAALREVLTQAGFADRAPGWKPTADDVRAEASRRMQALVGARDAAHLDLIIANANREAIRLIRKEAGGWTADEARRAAELEAADAGIEAIRAASNIMEAAPPSDVPGDARWPTFQ